MSYNIKETVAKLKQISEGHLGTMADRVELDHEVQLARGQLYKIAKYAIKLHEAFKDVSEVHGLDGWVSAKITEAAQAMDDVAHFMEYELSPLNVANEEIEHKRLQEEEGTAADLLHKYADKLEQPQIEPKVDGEVVDEEVVDEGETPQNLLDRLKADADTAWPDWEDADLGLDSDRTSSPERVPYEPHPSKREVMQKLIDKVDGDTDDDPGMDSDRTVPLDLEFSKRVAAQNAQNRNAITSQGSNGPTTSSGLPTPDSKYSDWSK